MPSLVYWPSAIGKDAFIVLAAGVAAYGVACLLVNRTVVGVAAISAGIGGMVMVRPHFALALCGGLALAVLVRRHRGDFFRTIISLVFVVGLALVVVDAASSFFGISAFNQASVTKSLNDASAQSAEGGSKFNPVVVNSPAKFPLAMVTVLYRPHTHTSGANTVWGNRIPHRGIPQYRRKAANAHFSCNQAVSSEASIAQQSSPASFKAELTRALLSSWPLWVAASTAQAKPAKNRAKMAEFKWSFMVPPPLLDLCSTISSTF